LSTQQHPRPLDIDFKMILFAVGPKYPNGPWVRGRAYGELSTDRELISTPSYHGACESFDPTCGYFLSCRLHDWNGMYKLRYWQSPQIGLPELWSKTHSVHKVTKVKWAHTCLYQKQYLIPRGILGIGANIVYFK
jgi:hypothetical protein